SRGKWVGGGYSGGAVFFDCFDYYDANNRRQIKINEIPEMAQFTLLFRMKVKDTEETQLTSSHIVITPGFHAAIEDDDLTIVANGISENINIKIYDRNNWHHFAILRDGYKNEYYVYKNGELAKYASGVNRSFDPGSWYFGRCNATDSLAFELDEIKIYNTALTQEQILEEYNYNEIRCDSDIWECGSWGTCSIGGHQTRICNKTFNCEHANTPFPSTSQTCTPECIEDTWSCGDWGTCSIDGIQARNCNKTYNCPLTDTPSPETTKSCTPECIEDVWECGSWGDCSSNGQQTRICTKTYDCSLIDTPSPATTQSCTYAPYCTEDTWQCGNWGICSPQGIKTRSCNKTYDCQSAETASPATSQYCEAPNKPQPQTPSDDLEIINQSSIIKATVKLLCPVSETMASQGSGTIIDSDGTILTNKHVIDGTAGCWMGFIDDYDDEPYFGDRQIADIYKVSDDADVAVLKLRNPSNKILTSINISQSNSSNIQLGEILTTYGYPGKFGTKITYTSGDFSGVDGNYLKTTAIIEYGNSGGGAYLKNGTFIGIPSAVMKGDLNSMGYILSVNKINSWLNNSIAYNYNSNNNNYSRVSSILEDMDLSAISSLGLFVAGDEENIKTATESQKVIQEEKFLITKIDKNLSKRMKGNILLQVEKNGEGWYVNPDNEKKYYLGRPADAFSIMRNLGLGIKNSELNNYINSKFPDRLSGKIMLDVEKNGEAYYVNPNNLKGYYLNRPADAFRVMRELGLGITNNDIRKIDVGEIE
ncbi:MAG: trypsin-like peptidase domain-containing protein, partial [bacterium]